MRTRRRRCGRAGLSAPTGCYGRAGRVEGIFAPAGSDESRKPPSLVAASTPFWRPSVKRLLSLVGAATTLAGGSVAAQDLAGTWQGTITDHGATYRQILKVRDSAGARKAFYYSLDQSGHPFDVASLTLDHGSLTLTFAPNPLAPPGTTYQGKLSANGHSIVGTWTDPDGRYPLTFERVTSKQVWSLPPSHTVRFVAVSTNVKLEVLDWGGSGPPLVFLPGLGNDAHVFDWFAPRFTGQHHVYGITRRGFGASSAPDPTSENYDADRLGDDVLAVLDSLHLDRPIVAGHSIGGEELSSIGTRRPERVAGLVYLDSYWYAYYDTPQGNLTLDAPDIARKLLRLQGPGTPQEQKVIIRELLTTDLPHLEAGLRDRQHLLDPVPDTGRAPPMSRTDSIENAVIAGEHKYFGARCPVLAIFAAPHTRLDVTDSVARARYAATDSVFVSQFADAFAQGNSRAVVVRLRGADHYVFRSHPDDVYRAMSTFMNNLP